MWTRSLRPITDSGISIADLEPRPLHTQVHWTVGVGRSCRRGDEVLQNVRHSRRRFHVWEVSDALEHLESAAFQRVMGGVGVRDGNDSVVISPDQHGWQPGREVKLV